MSSIKTSKQKASLASKPSRSSASEAYEMMLEAIENGTFVQGKRLREIELATQFSISRTPVREALKKLETQGLVVHEPHHGAVVATLDYGQTTELYLIREVLEGTAARLAAIHATSVEVELLSEMVVRDRKLIGRPNELARTNRLFHQQIRNSARNRFLSEMLENLRLSLALLAGTTLGEPGRGEQSINEHEAIIERIRARDEEGAEIAAQQHIRAAFKARIEILHK